MTNRKPHRQDTATAVTSSPLTAASSLRFILHFGGSKMTAADAHGWRYMGYIRGIYGRYMGYIYIYVYI